MGKLDEDGLLRYDAEIKDYIGNATTKYSENLSGNIEQDAEFAFRPTAGSLDVAEQANSDQALIKGVKGRTVGWNQLVQNGDFSDGTTGWTTTASVVQNVGNGNLTVRSNTGSSVTKYSQRLVSTMNLTIGNSYLISAEIQVESASTIARVCFIRQSGGVNVATENVNSLTYTRVNAVGRHVETDYRFALRLQNAAPAGGAANFRNVMLIDLTLIYGEGNEPSTAEEFEQDYFNWFGKPLTYEAYTAGELRNLNMVGIKTQGFNLLGSGTMPIKWNQLANNNSFPSGVRTGITYTRTSDGQATTLNGTATSADTVTGWLGLNNINKYNHAIYFTVNLLSGEVQGTLPEFLFVYPDATNIGRAKLNQALVAKVDKNDLIKSRFSIPNGTSFINAVVTFITVDLTLLYGEGNEPTSAEQFEADYKSWFGKELTYEAYNEGTEMNVPVGKTLVMADTPYQLSGDFTTIKDSQGTAITPDAQGLFTPEETTEVTVSGVGDDTCLHFVHSGRRNGEYESHWEETKWLDLTKVKGKLDGTGSSVYVCPQGLLQAGAIRDEIYIQDGKRWFAKRVGRVDLGTLTWGYNAESTNYSAFFSTQLTGIKSISTWTSTLNGVCSKYTPATGNNVISKISADKLFGGQPNTSNLRIKDTSYTTAANFKTAMSGVYLNYELATPEYYLLDDEWQDDAVWSYKVDDWGTEEVVSEFSPVVKQSAPFVGIITYGVNALDTLRNLTKNFVATTSNQGLTEAQRARARNNISALGMYDADYVANITYENNAIRQATWENPDDGEPIATDVVTVAQLKADMGVDALTQRVANIEAIIGDSSGDEQLFRFDSEQLAIGYTLTGDEAALFLATLNSHQYWRFMVYTLYDNELQYETAMSAVQFISGNEGAILRGVGINGNVTMYAHFNSDGTIVINNTI